MMKKLSIFISALVIILMTMGMALSCKTATQPTQPTQPTQSAKPKEPVLLRLSTAYPAGDEMCVHLDEVIAKFNERAGGEYEIKHFPSEQLAKVPEALDAVRTGAVEMTLAAPGIFAGLDPRLSTVPFLFNNVEANTAAAEGMLEIYDELYTAQFNQKVVSCFTTGALEVISRKPIKTLGDWDGLLVGALDPDTSKLTTILGGAPVVIPWTEGYAALEKGVIDANWQGSTFWIIAKLYDVASYGTFFYGLHSFQNMSVNLDAWNKMPKKIQDIMIEEMHASMQDRGQFYIKKAVTDREELTRLGLECYVIPAAERAKWKAVAQPAIDEQISSLGDFGKKMKEIADKANKENPSS
jgi:TRAP-type C4-dicarboxylate transport system substrate-binding protein